MLAKTARDVGHVAGTAAGGVTRDILKHQEDVNRRVLPHRCDPIDDGQKPTLEPLAEISSHGGSTT